MENNIESETPLFPSYKETLKEVGKQMNERKGILVRRVVLLIWPVWILVIVSYIMLWSSGVETGVPNIDTLSAPWFSYLFYFIILWLGFTLFWYFVMGFIFEIEQKVWVDSYFDGRNLDPKASWRVARRLFFPTVRMAFLTLIRFYLPAIIFIVIGAIIPYYAYTIGTHSPELFVLSNAAGLILAIVYCYTIHLRLRYLGFLFLDEFNPDTYSYTSILRKMRELNRIDTRDVIKRIFISDIATTSFEGMISVFTHIIESQIRKLGRLGQLAGSLFGVTTDAITMHVCTESGALYDLSSCKTYRF